MTQVALRARDKTGIVGAGGLEESTLSFVRDLEASQGQICDVFSDSPAISSGRYLRGGDGDQLSVFE